MSCHPQTMLMPVYGQWFTEQFLESEVNMMGTHGSGCMTVWMDLVQNREQEGTYALSNANDDGRWLKYDCYYCIISFVAIYQYFIPFPHIIFHLQIASTPSLPTSLPLQHPKTFANIPTSLYCAVSAFFHTLFHNITFKAHKLNNSNSSMNLPIIPKQSPYQVPLPEHSSTIVPLLSRKFSTPLCSTLHIQKEPFSQNIRQSYRETQQENSDSMGTIVHKKYSLRDIFKPNANGDEALETKKQVSLQKSIRGYNGLGQTVKRLNGVLPKQFVIKRDSSSRNNPFNETQHVNTDKNSPPKQKKHLSEDKMNSKRNLSKIISLERICRNSPPRGHQHKINSNLAKPTEAKNLNSDNRQLTKIGIILSKGNHKTLLAKLNQPPAPTKSILPNESIHIQPHMSNGGQSPRYQTVALGSFFQNSMGFGESIIEERQISNESSFLEQNGRELLQAITNDRYENHYNSNSLKDKEIEKRKRENNRGLGKRGWRKLPNDFIQDY